MASYCTKKLVHFCFRFSIHPLSRHHKALLLSLTSPCLSITSCFLFPSAAFPASWFPTLLCHPPVPLHTLPYTYSSLIPYLRSHDLHAISPPERLYLPFICFQALFLVFIPQNGSERPAEGSGEDIREGIGESHSVRLQNIPKPPQKHL